jgi:hypothetical protein
MAKDKMRIGPSRLVELGGKGEKYGLAGCKGLEELGEA